MNVKNNKVIAYLGVGSNLGNREQNIKAALLLLNENRVEVLKCSRLIETEPVGGPPGQYKYLNGVIKISTDYSALELLTIVKTIERKLGRLIRIENGPRPIDLDILLYGHVKLKLPQLTIPHPRMLERDFVMNPLLEIEPKLFEKLSDAHH